MIKMTDNVRNNITNNQKCLLSSKSVYYNDFWRSCDTEDWCWIFSFDHRNKLHLKYIHMENSSFKL